MRKLVEAYVKNAARALFTGSTWFDPMLPTLYVTPLCNLRCTYCADFGAHRNQEYKNQVLPLRDMTRLVDILADECDLLYVTGGEPTMRADLPDILRHARRRKLRYVAMNTNALLLRDHAEVLDLVDNLVISVDDLASGRWDSTLLGPGSQAARKLMENVRWAAGEQARRHFTLTVTCVVMPGRVAAARRVRDFVYSVGAQFSAQHLSEDRVPALALRDDPDFQSFVDELVAEKRAGRSVSGSELYLSSMRDQKPYACTPTAAPHVDWLGRLAYPCRELPNHVLIDVLEAGSYRAALAEGARRWGAPPRDCHRCGERCYVEISTLVRRPQALAREVFGYLKSAAAARQPYPPAGSPASLGPP
jgi:MoaA/NifB/PqqE/SkfB family radical SAM enzyme